MPPIKLLDLLRVAEHNVPANPEPTASKFAEWVYTLYEKKKPSALTTPQSPKYKSPKYSRVKEAKMKLGVFCENKIEEFKLWKVSNSSKGEWELLFGRPRFKPGNNVELSTETEVLKATLLDVGGQPLRCVPDAVLRHTSNRNVIIIERKVTTVPINKIPREGWPNLAAQLWAYSYIDNWYDAPNIFLIGQFWSAECVPKLLPIYPKWMRTDQEMELCEKLFDIYSGRSKKKV